MNTFLRQLSSLGLILAVLTVSACATTDSLADATGNYTSADGAVSQIAPENRGEPISFHSTNTTNGSILSSETLRGSVVVVNFWYASCPPCRVEAPTLATIAREYAKDVRFVGVNVYDEVEVARSFEKNFDIPYASALDVNTGEVRLAFAGSLSPNAVPTTIILDREGRLAARISGAVIDDVLLTGVIDSILSEDNS